MEGTHEKKQGKAGGARGGVKGNWSGATMTGIKGKGSKDGTW